jgi:hypothetical protein
MGLNGFLKNQNLRKKRLFFLKYEHIFLLRELILEYLNYEVIIENYIKEDIDVLKDIKF